MKLTKKQNIFLSSIVLILMSLFILNPKTNLEACLNGLMVWATSIAPALFPFLIFTKLLSELNFVENVSIYLSPITKKLYRVPGISAYIYTMSVLSGYPVGAKLTADFYEKGVLTKDQACRIVTFTSTSGPLFIIGTVGIGMFASKIIGITILISHFVGAIFNGLLYRNYMYSNVNITEDINLNKIKSENLLEDIMLNSIKSILIIGGYVAIFFVIITMLNNTNLLLPINNILNHIFDIIGLPTSVSSPIVNGLVEVTKGCLDLSQINNISSTLKCAIATFLISFGGLSIHMQSLTFIKRFDIKLSFYFLQKATHAIISTIIAILICSI